MRTRIRIPRTQVKPDIVVCISVPLERMKPMVRRWSSGLC